MNGKEIAGAAGGAVGKFVSGGVGWQVYAWVALAGAAAMGGALWWHDDQVDNHYEASFKAGRLEAENDQIREQQRELTRMVGITNNLNEAYREQIQTIADAESRAAADADRMRQLKAQRSADLATAPAEAVRRYAAVASDVYAACRAEYRALGFDAGRCSAAAHTLDAYADEVSRTKIDNYRATLRTKPE